MLKKGVVRVSEMQGTQWELCYAGHRLASSERVQTKVEVLPSTRNNFACG